MFVLSCEGLRWMDRDTWATHMIIGTYQTKEDAVAKAATLYLFGEDIAIITNTETMVVERIMV